MKTLATASAPFTVLLKKASPAKNTAMLSVRLIYNIEKFFPDNARYKVKVGYDKIVLKKTDDIGTYKRKGLVTVYRQKNSVSLTFAVTNFITPPKLKGIADSCVGYLRPNGDIVLHIDPKTLDAAAVKQNGTLAPEMNEVKKRPLFQSNTIKANSGLVVHVTPDAPRPTSMELLKEALAHANSALVAAGAKAVIRDGRFGAIIEQEI